MEHVSILDAPEPVEEPEVVVEEPEEEYDPYLERIEEAIAAVTGLPRRRPGAAPPGPEPVATPAAAVSMFADESSALGPAFEPMALPSQYDESPASTERAAAAVHEEPEAQSNVFSPASAGPARRRWPRSTRSSRSRGRARRRGGVRRGRRPVEEPVASTSPRPSRTHLWSSRSSRSRWRRPHAEPAEEPLEEPVAHDETPEADERAEADEQPETGWPAAPVAEDEPTHAPSVPAIDDGSQWGDDPLGAPAAVVVEPRGPGDRSRGAAGTGGPGRSDRPAEAAHRVPGPAARSAARCRPRRPRPRSRATTSPTRGQPNTPIFGQLRSNWLNDDDESRLGRHRGRPRLERRGARPRRRRRRRGHTPAPDCPYAVPAAAWSPVASSNEPTEVARDPEAIRNRLAAHAAGVSRGRAAAAAQPVSNDYAHEETGPA